MGADPGEGLEPAGVSEAATIIADLGEHPGTGEHPQPGEAGDDLGVRVLFKMSDRRLGQFVGGAAGGVELAQQGREVDAHRVLHRRWWLVQVGVCEDLPQTCGVAVQIAFATGLDQQTAQPGRRQLCRLGWGGCGGQDGAGVGAGQPAVGQLGKRRQRGR